MGLNEESDGEEQLCYEERAEADQEERSLAVGEHQSDVPTTAEHQRQGSDNLDAAVGSWGTEHGTEEQEGDSGLGQKLEPPHANIRPGDADPVEQRDHASSEQQDP